MSVVEVTLTAAVVRASIVVKSDAATDVSVTVIERALPDSVIVLRVVASPSVTVAVSVPVVRA